MTANSANPIKIPNGLKRNFDNLRNPFTDAGFGRLKSLSKVVWRFI